MELNSTDILNGADIRSYRYLAPQKFTPATTRKCQGKQKHLFCIYQSSHVQIHLTYLKCFFQAPQFCLSSTSCEVCQHLELDWAKSHAMAKKAIIRTLALLWVKWEAIEGFEASVCDISHSSQSYCYSVYPFMWIRKWCPFLWAVIAPGWMSWQAEHRLDFSFCCPLLPYFRTLCIVYSLCTHIQWPCLSVLCGE